jgi:hypothetical protein
LKIDQIKPSPGECDLPSGPEVDYCRLILLGFRIRETCK